MSEYDDINAIGLKIVLWLIGIGSVCALGLAFFLGKLI